MKFSLAIVASLASSALAAKSSGNLRASTSDIVTEQMSGRFQISGLLHLPTANELKVVDDVIMSMYNRAYDKSTKQISNMASDEAILVGDESLDTTAMVLSSFSSELGDGYCNLCT